jgi:PAS domain S-box-containing protein
MAIERRNVEGKRRASDHMFQAMFMGMDEGVVLLNKSGEVVAVNPAAENILGMAATELIGRSTAECVQALNCITEDETPLSAELHPAMLALQTGKPQQNVLVGAHRPDGTQVWLSINAQPMVSDGEAGPYGVVTTFRDVTERKRTEDALYFVAQRGWVDSNENFFDALAQYLGKSLGVDYAVIKRLDEDSGHVETIALYAKGEIVPNKRFPLKGTPYKNVLERKFCIYPQGVRQLFPEDPLLAELGAESYAGLALWDSAGQPLGLVSIMCSKPLREESLISKTLQVVAPRVAAELERERNDRILRQSEREFRSLAENMPDNVVRHDRQARTQYMNPAMTASLAPEVRPVLGESFIETNPGNDEAASCQRVIEQVIATGAPAEVEFQIPNPRGEMRSHHVRYVAERDDNGEIVGALGIGQDITERKRMEDDIQRRELEFRTLAENMPDNVVRYDWQARVLYMNPAIMANVAPEFRPVLGESPIETYPDRDGAAGHQRIVEQVIATGMPAEWEFQTRDTHGEMRIHHARYVAERDGNGEIVGALGIGRDITERKEAERQLRQALEFTQGVINAIPDLLFEVDRVGTYLNVWARTPELLLAQKEVLLGKTVSDVMAPDAAEVALSAIREAEEKGMSFGKVLRLDLPRGESWFELSVSKRPGSDVPGHFIVLSRDITRRRRMEQAVAAREQEFRSLAESSPDCIIRYDIEHRMRYLNSNLVKDLRLASADEVIGKCPIEVWPDGRFAVIDEAAKRAIATGCHETIEMVWEPEPGHTVIGQITVVPERDMAGEIIGTLAFSRDITELKRMEQTIAVREQEFRSLAESSPDSIIRYDRDGRMRYLNPGLLGYFGLSAADVIGRLPREVWPDGRYAEIDRAIARAMEAGEATIVELCEADATGALGFHQIHVVPERDAAGQIIGTIAFGREVTAIRETERKLRHFIENLPGMAYTFRLSPEGHACYPYVSPAIKELYGLDPDDVKDSMAPLHLLEHPDDRPRIETAIAESAQTMTPFHVEFRVCRPGQPLRWLDARSVPERRADGSIIWYGIMLDITERKLAEKYEQFRSKTLELLTGGASLPDILEGIVRGVEELDPEMICSILLLDSQGKRFRKGIGPSLPDSYHAGFEGLEIGIGVGSCGTAAATGERVIVDDIMTHPYWAPYKELAASAGVAACWSEPIRSSTGQVLGTFAAYHREVHSPAEFDISIIQKSTRLVSIAIERKQAGLERQAYANSLECMDRVNRAIQGATDLEQMMGDVQDVVLSIFGCDRAFLLYPCDPDAAEWRVPMERTRPEYPGAQVLGAAIPMVKEVAEVLRISLDADRPKKFGQGAEYPMPQSISEHFGVKSQMVMALFPKLNKPWQFGIHQCSHSRIWTRDEEALFEKIGWRLSDALTSLLMYRNLQASEQEFRTLAENLPDILVRYDREGRRTYANRALQRSFALTADELIGKTVRDNNPTGMEMMETYRRALEHTLATGERSEFEVQAALPDCNMRTGLCFIAAERTADGRISGAIAIARDITERKRMESEIRRREREFRSLAENSPDPIFRYDRDCRRLYANPASGVLSGYPVESLIGATIGDGQLLDAVDAARLTAGIHRVFDSSKPGCVDTVSVDRDGKRREYQVLLVPEQDEHGKVETVLGLARDITAIRDAERQMTEYVANLPGFAFTFRWSPGGHGSFPFASPGIENLVGLKPEDVKDDMAPLLALAHPDDAPRILAAIDESARTMMPYHEEARACRPGLPERWTELRAVPLRQADGSVLWHGIMLDIDERKRNEAELERHRHHLEKLVEDRTHALSNAKETAEAATRAKTHFLAAASHDLRQPLQAIRLFNDALDMTGLDEKQKKISCNLSRSVNSLGELLNQLLDISRLDAGTIKPQPVVIQANDLLGVIGAEFDAVSREKSLSLNLFCPRGNLALFSDDNLLLTILRNLVSNAVKYTARGGVLVSIRRRGDRALIQVWDTGIGIAPELTDLIFEEYFQIGNPERARVKGVGLGLSIVRRLSKLLDIGLRFRSRVGKGSVFELSVPLANESDMPASAVPASATPETVAPTRLAGKRIVVIEDDAIAAEAIKLSLAMAGAHVTLFATAEDALGNAEAMTADYYISDYRLPGMDGLQMLDAIQRNSAEPIKAVLLTGNTSTDQISRLQSSRWEVLFKPIDLPRLISAIEE